MRNTVIPRRTVSIEGPQLTGKLPSIAITCKALTARESLENRTFVLIGRIKTSPKHKIKRIGVNAYTSSGV